MPTSKPTTLLTATLVVLVTLRVLLLTREPNSGLKIVQRASERAEPSRLRTQPSATTHSSVPLAAARAWSAPAPLPPLASSRSPWAWSSSRAANDQPHHHQQHPTTTDHHSHGDPGELRLGQTPRARRRTANTPPPPTSTVFGETDPALAASELAYRSCCASAWRAHWRHRQVSFCEEDPTDSSLTPHDPSGGLAGNFASSFTCHEDATIAAQQQSKSGGKGDKSGGAASVWYCEASNLLVNTSAITLGSSDLSIPTSAQKGLWKDRALLLACRLRWDALRQPHRFGMLVRQLLPGAIAELPPLPFSSTSDHQKSGRDRAGGGDGGGGDGGGGDGGDNDGDGDGEAGGEAPLVVFVARYSVKNFFLAHYDLLQVAAILLHAVGPSLGGDIQLVFLPPDKANHGWWGPHKPLWAAFSSLPPLSYAEWVESARKRADASGTSRGRVGGGVAKASDGHERFAAERVAAQYAAAEARERAAGARHHGVGRSPPLLIPVPRAVFALSGQHSVYGRGSIGRSIERSCSVCSGIGDAASSSGQSSSGGGHLSVSGGSRMSRVSAFYRPFLSTALGRAGLLYLPSSPSRPLHKRPSSPSRPLLRRLSGLWIKRGVGIGNGYGRTVGRRCLNEPQVLSALAASDVQLSLTPLELSGMPFAEQLPHFRRAAVFTGMHGAGYANIIFLAPGSVVAELCPLGYCTQSYERISARIGLTYLRWTNSIPENAKEGYDTIVDPEQFVGLMTRAVKAWEKAGGGSGRVEGSAAQKPRDQHTSSRSDMEEEEEKEEEDRKEDGD